MGYLLSGVLGFFIGIYAYLFYKLGLKPIFISETEYLKTTQIDINIGDIVWYRGEKWEVIATYNWRGDYSDHKDFKLKSLSGNTIFLDFIDIESVKKVVRATNNTQSNHAD